jgi:hypothetical protein
MRAFGAVVAILLALLLGGCGEDSADGGGSRPQDEADVRRLVDRYFDALASGETSTACDMLGKEPRDRLAQLRGGTCADQLRTAFAEIPEELLAELGDARIATLKVDGDEAEVRMRRTRFSAVGADNPVRLTRTEGGWLITELPKGGRPSPEAQCLQGGVEAYEAGDAGRVWKGQGRAVFIEYMKRLCVRIVDEGLEEKPDDPRVGRLAEEVVAEMDQEGLIKE